MRNSYRILVGKPEGKRPLGRPRRRWEAGIKANFKEIGSENVDWVYLAQNKIQFRALVNLIMDLRTS
jgi:hypothetical protein